MNITQTNTMFTYTQEDYIYSYKSYIPIHNPNETEGSSLIHYVHECNTKPPVFDSSVCLVS